ncbi:MAG: tetratricopeptide repeat protein [Treponema sp.]|nr:tetratricopeptide repeat protein [Treponema sp.]
MKPKRTRFTKAVLMTSLITFLFGENLFAAKKKNKTPAENDKKVEVQQTNEQTSMPENNGTPEDGTSIRLPAANRTKLTYFYKIDSEIVKAVENGSPDSIRWAMTKIRKSESDYSENEKVLIYVAASLFETLYPSEKRTWEVFEVAEENAYTGAIKSAKNGIFDSSTGNEDFLLTILPTLVMFNSSLNDKEYLNCEDSILKALEQQPESVISNYIAGYYYLLEKNYALAEQYLEKAYGKYNKSREIVLAYSKTLLQNNNASYATEIMMPVLEKNPEDIQVLKQMAYVSFGQKNYSDAEEYVARVLQQTPNDLDFVLFRAKILVEKNDFVHAVSLLNMYSRQNDTSLEYLVLRARVQLDWSKNTTAATETIERALQLYPDSEEALLIATKISSATDSPVAGKYADELAEIILKNHPENKEVLVFALDGLLKRENWQEAYEISVKLLKNDSDSSEIIQRHVTVCLALGKKTEAFNVASKAYAKNPDDENITQSYIQAYVEQESRDDSLALINNLLTSCSPKMKSYLYYRRSFLQITEENTLADLRASLVAGPRNSDALFRLYEIYYEKDDFRKAQYYLRQVVAINPNDSTTRKLNEALTQLIQ